MSTSALFVELLIIGFEALTWIGLLISSLLGPSWTVQVEAAFDKASILSTAVIFGIAYVMGIIVDEVSEAVTETWTTRVLSPLRETDSPELWDMQTYVFAHAKEGIPQLAYMRSRVRILRASIINMPIICTSALIFIWTRLAATNTWRANLTIATCLVGLMLTGLVLYTYRRLTVAYWLGTQKIYRHLKDAPDTKVATIIL